MHWWLPNDECYPPIIRSIRKFVEERTLPAKDLPSEDLRDMKAIFSSLNLEDESSSEPPHTGKAKSRLEYVSVASHLETTSTTQGNMPRLGGLAEGDSYQLGFDNGHSYWGGDQSGGAYGIPNPEGFL